MQQTDGYPFTAQGACCARCGSSGLPNERPYDLDIYVDNETANGDLFLCENDAHELARLVGFVSPGDHEKVLERMANLVRERDFLRQQVMLKQAAFEAMCRALLADPQSALEMAVDWDNGTTPSPPSPRQVGATLPDKP